MWQSNHIVLLNMVVLMNSHILLVAVHPVVQVTHHQEVGQSGGLLMDP